MAQLVVYQYPQCSTCRKALKWLAARGIAFESIDIVQNPPSKAELRQALKGAAIPLRKLFNTSGVSDREGRLGGRLVTMTEADAIDALAKDGKLIKRPIVLGKGVALVGFDEVA